MNLLSYANILNYVRYVNCKVSVLNMRLPNSNLGKCKLLNLLILITKISLHLDFDFHHASQMLTSDAQILYYFLTL